MANLAQDQVRSDMRSLANFIRDVRREYPRMELGQLHVLLLALAKPGLRVSELQSLTGLTKSATSRSVNVLAEKSYLEDEEGARVSGLDLLTTLSDPLDSRAKIVAPTRRGRAFAERLSNTFKLDTNDPQET